MAIKYVNFEIICSFENLPQIIFDIKVPRKITEIDFVEKIFDELREDELKELIKISCMQRTQNRKELLPFIEKSWGKYYFNPDVNEDEETALWYKRKMEFLKKKFN